MEILPPENVSPVPDRATKKGMSDFTGPSADNRVLHINVGFFKYGTNDKAHAAAMVLSLLLFASIGALLIFGMSYPWADKVFTWLGSAFLFVTGVAIGKGSAPDKPKEE